MVSRNEGAEVERTIDRHGARATVQPLRLALLLGSLAPLAWLAATDTLRDPVRGLDGRLVLPLALALALALLAAAVGRRLERAALWLGLGLLGQAITLQFIDAGTRLHYQHYRPPGTLVAEQPLGLALFALQAAVVLVALARVGPRLVRRIGSILGWARALLLATLFILTSATVSERVDFYLGELVFASFVQGIHLGTFVLMALAIPSDVLARWRERGLALLGEARPGPARLEGLAIGGALWIFVAAALLSLLAYERHPHITDEVIYVVHARYLAEGALWMPPPPAAAGFDMFLMQVEPWGWYPSPPVGWPALLAQGTHLGLGWLVNPLLGAANLLLFYLLVWELYDRRVARAALLLMAASPWFIFMAMNLMTHSFSLTCVLAGALMVVWARRDRPHIWAAGAGLMVGMAAMIRPLDGLITGALLGLWAVGVGGRRLPLGGLVAFGLGTLVVGGAMLSYNAALTGDPTTFPVMLYVDENFAPGANDLGFGPDRGLGWGIDPNPGHDPIDGLINANLNAFMINIDLFGWAGGSLLLVALYLISRRPRGADRAMLGVVGTVFIAYFFYYFSGGPDFGARYWYMMIVPLVVFTVRGIAELAARLPAMGAARLGVLIAAMSLGAVTLYIPWRAADKYHQYLGMRPEPRAIADDPRFDGALLLVRGDEHPDFASAFVYNPLDLTDPGRAPVFAHDTGTAARRALAASFPDRPVYLLDGPTITGSGYFLRAGPLSPDELATLQGESR